jgi:hypothetical protein
LGVSCKKETNKDLENISLNSSTNRLSFSKANFDKLYQKLRKTEKKQELKDFVELKNSMKEFISLSNSDLDSKISNTASKIIQNNLSFHKASANNKLSLGSAGKVSVSGGSQDVPTDTPPTYDEVVEELVDDESFATLLNEDGEIQVDDIIYKVTPFGTFFSSASNEIALENVFNNVYVQNDYTLRLYDPATPIELENISVTGTAYNDVKLLDQTVYFVDSFLEDTTLQPAEITYEDTAITYPIIFPAPNNTPSDPLPAPPSLPLENQQINILSQVSVPSNTVQEDASFQNMVEYPIEFRKGFVGSGSLLQTFFTNSTRYNNFDNSHRVSTLMYNRNYGVLKTIGIKVKFQKKGWLWWNAKNTDEIRAGWDYVSYKSARSIDRISLPSNDIPPSNGAPYLINPTENPYYATPMYGSNDPYAKRYNLYGWNLSRGSNNLFTVILPGWLVPFKPDGLEIPPAAYKLAINIGWTQMKTILRKSAPPTPPLIVNSSPDNYKFPVHSLNSSEVKYLSINEMENMPKSYNSNILRSDVLKDNKINTFVSPYETRVYNSDIIDIPFDISTVTITISTDPSNIALSLSQIAKSMITEELGTSYEVEGASIFGAAKYNNQWRAIRLKVKMKD